jgi:hypothetical protein
MTGFPSAEKLARLTAISRQTNGAGAQPPISNPVEVSQQGYVYGVVPGDAAGDIGVYLHSGIRVGWAPKPEKGGLIISIWGGLDSETSCEEGIAAFVTAEGLRRLAADLRAIAAASEAAT